MVPSTVHGRSFSFQCRRYPLHCWLLISSLWMWSDAAAAVSIEGNLVSELLHGFSDVVTLYALQNPALDFSLPLQASADNVEALLQHGSDFSLISGPLSPSQAQAQAQTNLSILPILSVALVPVYRLDALNGSVSLTFSRSTLALLFAGNITSWDDRHIADDNPGLALPSGNVTVAYQADFSFSTLTFLTALNKFESSISGVLPPSALPDWPVARYWKSMSGTGPTGVVAAVIDTDGTDKPPTPLRAVRPVTHSYARLRCACPHSLCTRQHRLLHSSGCARLWCKHRTAGEPGQSQRERQLTQRRLRGH